MSHSSTGYVCEKGHRFEVGLGEIPASCPFRGEHQWDWFGRICGAKVKPDTSDTGSVSR